MFRVLWLTALHLLLATVCGAADDASPTDFSPGFGKLQSLGLPALPKGTKWSTLPADLKKILKEVGKKSNDRDDPFDEDSYSNQRKAQQFGPLLIFAAQMHQAGNDAQANELAAALFISYPNREAILDSAVNRIADSHYQTAADTFFRTLEWKSYLQSVLSLVERFPRGWQNQSAAAILASALAQREKTGHPSIPQLKDIPLDPFGRSSDWLLMKPAELDAAKDAAAATRRLGIAALPVLAALADDSWLTSLPNPNASRGDYLSSDAGLTERALHAYAGLNRPASRGELATILLQTSLPDPENDLRSAEPLVLRDLALEFWQKHRDDTPEAIASRSSATAPPPKNPKPPSCSPSPPTRRTNSR